MEMTWYEWANHKAQELQMQFPNLHVEITGSWVWVSGDTRPVKDELKSVGLRWSHDKGKWYLKGKPSFGKKGMGWDYIVNKYGVREVREEQAAA